LTWDESRFFAKPNCRPFKKFVEPKVFGRFKRATGSEVRLNRSWETLCMIEAAPFCSGERCPLMGC